jgi:hypothetical protein
MSDQINQPWLDDPFVDANFDWRQLRDEEQQRAFRRHFGLSEPAHNDDPFAVNEPPPPGSLRKQLISLANEPEVRQELAKRNPLAWARNEAETVEEVIHEFRKATPDFKKSRQNERELIKFLCDKHLDGRDYGDSDRAALELLRAGAWSLESLQEAFQKCSAAGQLDMPEGRARELTQSERLGVIALLQAAGPGAAIERYVGLSMAVLPEFMSPHDVVIWRAEHPDVNNNAVAFVFKHSRPDVSDGDLKQCLTNFCRNTRC